MNYAQRERAQLCDLFLEVGPDAPTLCGDWTTRDLAAHLVVREGRPDAALGILLKPFEAHGEKVRLAAADQPWEDLVAKVRKGPPWYSVMKPGPIDKLVNTLEFFVHHEDVRRAQDGWTPRELEPQEDEELFTILRRTGKMLVKPAPCGVSFKAPEREAIIAKPGTPMVVLNGTPSELVMFAEGRQAHSNVDLVGDTDMAAKLQSAKFGI